MFGFELQVGPLVATLSIGIITIILIYRYSTRNHDYWKKRNVRYIKPLPFIGSLLDTLRKPQHELEHERYLKYGKVYGHFEANRALLSVAEPQLLRQIFVKDFPSFPSRRPIQSGDKIIDSMVSILEGDDWKRVRNIVTPTFSTGKIKKMMSIIKDCTKPMVENFKKIAENGEFVNLKQIYGAFTMDIIASSAFSTKLDSHNDPNNKFVLAAKNVFSTDFSIRLGLFQLFPGLMKFLGIPIFRPSTTVFFRDVTLQIIEERKRTGQTRNDFLQLLMDTAKDEEQKEVAENEAEDITSNYASEESNSQVYKSVSNKKLSLDELVAQSVIFFLAGYDTTASTLSFATYELALHPEMQERIYQEIQNAVQETKGVLTYEALQSLKYLDNVISETLRLYPPVVRLERECASDTTLGDTGITVPKGMLVSIPVYALHKDPQYYADPDRFNPDRFNAEERSNRDQYVYLPFGNGPRNCVGMRFALAEVKVCLAYMISTFRFKKGSQTKVPLDFNIGVGLLDAKEILIQLELRKEKISLK